MSLIFLGIVICDFAIKDDSKAYEQSIQSALKESEENHDIVFSNVTKKRTSPTSFQYKVIVKRSSNSPEETCIINRNFIYPNSDKVEFRFL